MAAPVIASAGSFVNSTAVPVPSGVASGSLVVVAIQGWWGASGLTIDSASWAAPAGFTFGGAAQATAPWGSTTGLSWWWKYATGADTGTYTFTQNTVGGQAGIDAYGVALRIIGAATSGNPFVDSFHSGTGTSSNFTVAAFTPGGDNSLLLASVVTDGNSGATNTNPSGWTTAAQIASVTHSVAQTSQTTAASTGTLTFSNTNGFDYGIALVATLRAPATTPATGTLTGSTPATTAGPPTATFTGTTTVPAYTGSLTASTPTATAGPPAGDASGTASPPAGGTGTLTGDAPTATAGPPAAAFAGAADVPHYGGDLSGAASDAVAGPPSADLSGTATTPGVFVLAGDAPTAAAGPPTATLTGVAAPPTYGGTLAGQTPQAAAGPASGDLDATMTMPVYGGALAGAAPAAVAGPPVAFWVDSSISPLPAFGTVVLDVPARELTIVLPARTMTLDHRPALEA